MMGQRVFAEPLFYTSVSKTTFPPITCCAWSMIC
jgi:hypothetical protein